MGGKGVREWVGDECQSDMYLAISCDVVSSILVVRS